MRRWCMVSMTWCSVWIVAAVAGKLYDSLFGLGATGTPAEALLTLNVFSYAIGLLGLPVIVLGWLVLVVRAAVRPRAPKQRLPLAKDFIGRRAGEPRAGQPWR